MSTGCWPRSASPQKLRRCRSTSPPREARSERVRQADHRVRRPVAAAHRLRCRVRRRPGRGLRAPAGPLRLAERAGRRRPGRRPGRHDPGRHRPARAQGRRRHRRRPGPDRRDGLDRHRRSRRLHVGPDPRLRPLRHHALRRATPRGRRLGVRRPGGRAARHRGGAAGLDPRPRAHRGLPAADVRGRRDDDLPGVQRPDHHVRGARGAVPAAVPAHRARPSAPTAEPGGGAEVLPARRVLLRLLPLRPRAGLRLRGLDGLLRHQRGDPQRREQPGPAARGHGPAVRRPPLQGRRGAVPVLDARRLPGRAHPGDRVHGGRHQGGRLRRPDAAVLRRLRRGPVVVAADALGRSRS